MPSWMHSTVIPLAQSPAVLLPRTVATVSPADRIRVFKDTEGYAYKMYGVTDPKELTVCLVRPDGVVGAIVSGADGVERYRQLIFS